ncbi:MAG: HEAT repeat domain-containing protein [Candidatus Saccharicenans sp.]
MPLEEKVRQAQKSTEEVDPRAIQKVKELLLSLANTISALKIFPAHHTSAIHFRQDFITKFKSFLEEYQQLEIEMGEYAFFYQGKQVYQDEISSKSLPFLFYKDGLRLLVFYQGMDEQEINEFLELVRTESAKTAEESDLVNALWLKDLPNVQYYAPEEFIENRILEERAETLSKKGLQIIPQELANKAIEITVDRSSLFSGKVELKPEEKQALESFTEEEFLELPENWQQSFYFEGEQQKKESTPEVSQPEEKAIPAAKKIPSELSLTQEELKQLNQLVEKNRQLSAEEEFLNLMMEILAQEKDLNQFQTNLNILYDFYQENIKNGHFNIPIQLNQKIKELKALLASEPDSKIPLLEDFLNRTSDLKLFDEIRKLVKERVELNFSALFDYLAQFGETALPFLAELYEYIDYQEYRDKTKELFQNKIQFDPGLIVSLIDDQRPQLTAAIIEIMRSQPGKKIIPHFSSFLTLSNQELKIKAIEALSSFSDEMANRILLGFLEDSSQEVRLKATTSLKFLGDAAKLKQLMKEVFTKKFKEKHYEEKKAFFEFLGKTRSQEAFDFLKKVFLKKSLRPSITELRLGAVAGLEAMETKEAVEVLRRGEKIFNRKVREAAASALVRLTLKKSSRK